jgi:hypothetical protein
MKQEVREAFMKVRGEYSSDVVVADPHLNKQFIRECKARGSSCSSEVLNLCLMNLRKSGDFGDVKSKKVSVRDQEDFRFASEIAIRFLERRDQVTLDQILCNPRRAAQFDKVASQIAPGFSSFQYRWAALNLRKRSKLRPELLGKVVLAENVILSSAKALRSGDVPVRPGLYILIEAKRVLYVGECQNLRQRISRHLEHSDNKGLARWLWKNGIRNLHVEYHVLPAGTPVRVRRAMELELIRSRNPFFNVVGVTGKKRGGKLPTA